MHALLNANGESVSPHKLKQLAHKADFIAAADGGAVPLLRAGLMPKAVIGDLDSLPVSLRRKIPPQNLIFIHTQHNNDLEKALSYLVKRGVSSCTITGLTGGRMDFTLGNFLLLARFAKKMQLHVAGENWDFFILTQSRRFTCQKGIRASLLPLRTSQAVSLKGFKYPLLNARLLPGTTRTLSNITTSSQITVQLKSGVLGLYLQTH